MPDLTEQLSAILSDPDAQKNIQSMLSSLGMSGGGASESSAAPDLSALSAMFSGGSERPAEAPPIDMGALMSIQKVFSRMNADDKNVALLRALKPHLKEPDRVDEAIRILQLMSVLPALGESGLFGRR